MRLNAFQLKIFAMVLMVIDHVYTYIPGMTMWMHHPGRIVAPIFFYFVVEGFFYTRNRKKYATRVFIWAAIMFAGSALIQYMFPREGGLHNNIFLSLGFGIVLLCVIDYIKCAKNYLLGIPAIIIVALLGMFTEANIFGVTMTLIFYFFREKKMWLIITYVLLSLSEVPTLLMIGELFTDMGLFGYGNQWMMVFALPFFFLYNGERGVNNAFTKYMFYIFYPAHLWIIYTIGYFVSK
ncbi:conjugal transfer protein TraX [Bacillus thuringiensis]|uniref:Conjugal transfer protein TraX n=1 Tax=Bacillus thuringiensis TaxID=1428 RepID=A0ABD6SDT9_BACTU|nr:TraX family protein [Bacillus thuringiensis]PER58891.1 conjugal transfer protein TraX [Bacillus thuringiensis]PEU67345.1 conjugal transfer protein TraX [Bacillus thuringiensis]PFI00627.1 conjugal transfer protein TraX [Bacillus thuringiensis]PFW36720.1 conjugal transfer protein TraX [Bacillus thuringiensis]PGY60499.1 conjugal transfer protein TraX [Bacillus thuringiensis]